MKKGMLMLGVLLLLLGTFYASAQDEDSATQLTIGNIVTGNLDADNFAQNYIFTGYEGNTVTLSATPVEDTLTLAVLLSGPQGRLLAQAGGADEDGSIAISNFELPRDGIYTVTVLRGEGISGDSEGSYRIVLTGSLDAPTVESPALPEETAEPEAEPEADATAEATAEASETEAAPTSTESPSTEGSSPSTDVEATPPPLITLQNGGISIALTWNAAVNFDLEVRDPIGGSIYDESPNTPSGGNFSGNVNGDCTAAEADDNTEAVIWAPGAVPVGSYEVIIYYTSACDIGGPQDFTVVATVNNEQVQSITGTLNPEQQQLAALYLEEDGTWALRNGGVNAGLNVSLLSQQIAAAQPLQGNTATGIIDRRRPAIAYTFQGTANTPITITMNRSTGSLDTYLILLDSNGAEVARNDDSDDISTDSAISTTLPATDTYTVVATRYGQTIGGTEGGFQLNVTTADSVAGTGSNATPGIFPTIAAAPPGVVATQPPAAGAGQPSANLANLPDGSIEVLLTWGTQADVQLLVRDPIGQALYDDQPQLGNGATLFSAGNVRCTGTAGTQAVSYAYWPATITPPGIYEVEIWHQDNCGDPSPVAFNLVVDVNGQQVVNNTNQPLPLDAKYMITFEIAADGNVTVFDGGIFDMANATSTIDYFSRLADAVPISYGATVSGNITLDERFEIYSFPGQIGDVVRISMIKTSDTLDPTLYLLSQDGIQIAFNDDTPDQSGDTRNTNSLIQNVQLTSNGTYYIIATHYGQEYGGTVGSYTLTLAGGAP